MSSNARLSCEAARSVDLTTLTAGLAKGVQIGLFMKLSCSDETVNSAFVYNYSSLAWFLRADSWIWTAWSELVEDWFWLFVWAVTCREECLALPVKPYASFESLLMIRAAGTLVRS